MQFQGIRVVQVYSLESGESLEWTKTEQAFVFDKRMYLTAPKQDDLQYPPDTLDNIYVSSSQCAVDTIVC